MQNIILAIAVAITVLVISSIRSARLRAIIYCLPIPISIILLGTHGHVNATHLFGVLLVFTFTSAVWLFHAKMKIHIVPSIVLSVGVYVLLGMLNNLVVKVSFWIMYSLVIALWIIWNSWQPLRFNETKSAKPKPLGPMDYTIRGLVVFVCTYLLIAIRSLIFGAAVTFPFNGIFTTYIMQDQLLVLANELGRNFMGLFTFFLTVFLAQDHMSLVAAVGIGWVTCGISIYLVSRYLPRKSPILPRPEGELV